MNYPNIHQKIHGDPWMVRPQTFISMATTLDRVSRDGFRADEVRPVEAFHDGEDEAAEEDTLPPGAMHMLPWEYMVLDGTAIIPIRGIMGKHLSSLEMMCGACSIDLVSAYLDEAMEDPSVSRILLRIDSPGGQVTGTPELADKVSSIRRAGEKDIIAFTDSLCASAAYYVASGCHYILCTRSAIVGSVGVVMSFVNFSKAYEQMGIEHNIFTTGNFKATGNPARQLTDEEKAWAQNHVEETFSDFRQAVIDGRGDDVSPEVWEAQIFEGPKAVEAGLVDEVVEDLSAAAEYQLEVPGLPNFLR